MKHPFTGGRAGRTMALIVGIGFTTLLSAQLPYQNPNLTPEQRATDLLQRLTLEEKASLMQNASPAIPRLGIKPYEWWNEALHAVVATPSATILLTFLNTFTEWHVPDWQLYFRKPLVWQPHSMTHYYIKYLMLYLMKPELKTGPSTIGNSTNVIRD